MRPPRAAAGALTTLAILALYLFVFTRGQLGRG